MTRNIRRTRPAILAAGAIAAATVALTGASPAQAAPAPEADATHQVIASSTLGTDVRVTVTAVRSTADPLAATVKLSLYTYTDGAWHRADQTTVGGTDSWFWYPLTGPQAVCTFSTSSTPPDPIGVSLLVTPSIGCSPLYQYSVVNGHLVAG